MKKQYYNSHNKNNHIYIVSFIKEQNLQFNKQKKKKRKKEKRQKTIKKTW